MSGKKTIVVKIGTSSLTEKSGRLSPERLRSLTAQVAQLRDEGHQVVMVTSAAIAAVTRCWAITSGPRRRRQSRPAPRWARGC